MEELYTKEKLGKILVEQVIKDIESWANKELKYLSYSVKSPICLPLGKNTWLAGHYKIVRNKKKQYNLYSDDTLINKFNNKQAAFMYASMDKLKKYDLAQRILNSDRLYGFLYEELLVLSIKQKRYIATSNNFKLLLIDAKLSDTKRKLISARQDLEKNLNYAKYVKVWD